MRIFLPKLSWSKTFYFVSLMFLVSTATASLSINGLGSGYFEQNVGQVGAKDYFLMRGDRYSLAFRQSELVFSLQRLEGEPLRRFSIKLFHDDIEPRGHKPLTAMMHFLKGDTPGSWRRDVPLYKEVRYQSPGVETVFYFSQGYVEYDFWLSPGTPAANAGFLIAGADKIELTSTGELNIILAGKALSLRPPQAYQLVDGERKPVGVKYRLENNKVQFDVAHYDSSLALVIDPVIDYLTYWGGTGDESAKVLRYSPDGSGEYYIAGTTVTYAEYADLDNTSLSIDSGFLASPASLHGINGCNSAQKYPQPFTTTVTDYDAFVARFAPDHSLIAATYIGGCGNDSVRDMEVKQIAGDILVYIAGFTVSPDFPKLNAPQQRLSPEGNPEAPAADAFVTRLQFLQKIDAETALPYETVDVLFSTYLGGEGQDGARGIAVDDSGVIYVAGYTHSRVWPGAGPCPADGVTGVVQCQHSLVDEERDPEDWYNTSASDGFIARIGNQDLISYISFLGGRRDDWATEIAVGNQIVVAGNSRSYDFPLGGEASFRDYRVGSGACSRTVPPFDVDAHPCEDVFVVKLPLNASEISVGTYLGGDEDDTVTDMVLDDYDNVYVAGVSRSKGIGVKPDGLIDPAAFDDSLLLPGETRIEDKEKLDEYALSRFPLVNNKAFAYTPTDDANDTQIFLTKFDSILDSLRYSFFLGGSNRDGLSDLKVSNGSVYLVGHSSSSDFVTTSGFQAEPIAGDGFIVKLDEDPQTGIPSLSMSSLFGGERLDYIDAVDVASDGKILFVGGTQSTYLPLLNPIMGSQINKRSYVVSADNPYLDTDQIKDAISTDLFVGVIDPAASSDVDLSLQMSSTVSGNLIVGNPMTLSFIVENKGTETAKDVRLYVNLPSSGISKTTEADPLVVAGTENCVLVDSPSYCLLGDIVPEGKSSQTIMFTFKVKQPGEMFFSAAISSQSFDKDLQSAQSKNQQSLTITAIAPLNSGAISPVLMGVLLSFFVYCVVYSQRFSR